MRADPERKDRRQVCMLKTRLLSDLECVRMFVGGCERVKKARAWLRTGLKWASEIG